MMAGMQPIIDILNARAKLDTSGVPEFKAEHNGMRLSLDLQTRGDFPTASEAINEARTLAAEILAVPGWVAVSTAELGAVVNALPARRGAPTSQWHGRVQLVLATDEQVAAERDVPYFPVTGVTD